MKPLTNQKVLITGGAGFIGSHLADRLLSMNNKIIVYDNMDEYYPGKEENIRHNLSKNNYFFVKGNISDYTKLLECMKGVKIVFHLAAQPGVRFSMINPQKTIEVNVLGTLNVLRACNVAHVKRMIFASSSSVYGETSRKPVDENHLTKPTSVYGLSKLAAEQLCQVYGSLLGLNFVILRYHTVYGPRQRPDMAIYKWTKQIFDGKPVIVYGDGYQTRDFTYVDDVVDATIKAAEVNGIEGEIFNIGGGKSIQINQVIKLLAKITNTSVKVIYEPPKIGDVQHTCADISKARKMLGFEPKTKFEDGLKKFVEWYKAYKLGN